MYQPILIWKIEDQVFVLSKVDIETCIKSYFFNTILRKTT